MSKLIVAFARASDGFAHLAQLIDLDPRACA
jgi:hypothetical protein